MSDANDIFDGEVIEANESTAIIKVDTAIEIVEAERELMQRIRNDVFIEGVHYGKVPGVDKPFLWQPGAESLMSAFSLWPDWEPMDKQTVWDPENPLFYFQYRCILRRIGTNEVRATAIGSCNSWEEKFRYKQGARVCPECKKETIRQSKPDKGGGFYCWTKLGGCGAQFRADDERITGQSIDRHANLEIFSKVNDLDAMAQKRSFVRAVIKGCRASREFTPGDGPDYSKNYVRPLTAAEARALVDKWTPMLGAEIKEHLLKAIGPASHWTSGLEEADKAIIQYIANRG